MHSEHETAFSEIRDILANYDLGELVSIERDELGYVNTSHKIETLIEGERKKYFFRRYKMGIQETEIQFEHSVINHLLDKDFSLVAKVLSTRQGVTYYKYFTDEKGRYPIFYAIFEFLRGEDKYNCVDPHPSLLEMMNSAVVQAEFHHAVVDLVPNGQRFEPKILDLVPQITAKIHHNLKSSKGTIFDHYLRENEELIHESCDEAEQYFAALEPLKWNEILIHCDYHPGNLKFDGEEVVGLFDFDWSKIDLRSFDVALAIWYFFANWHGDQDGVLRIDEARIYLQEYQSTLSKLHALDPLDNYELQHFPMMINLGNLYVLNWAISDFYTNDVDPELYLMWLKHCVNFTQWFSGSGQQLIEQDLIGY
jgi:homoserine kinase type II